MTTFTFTPPTVRDGPRTVPWPHPANDLFKYFRPLERGISVFKLADGTYTQTQPPNDVGVVWTYHGGHEHPVDATEAFALAAAGYGAYITPGGYDLSVYDQAVYA